MAGPSQKFIDWVSAYKQEPTTYVKVDGRHPGAKRLAQDLEVTVQAVHQWLKPHGKCRPVPATPRKEHAKKMVSLSEGTLTLEDVFGAD